MLYGTGLHKNIVSDFFAKEMEKTTITKNLKKMKNLNAMY
jgi:hypothetical protein